ncbi:MAG: hypothetical protein NUW06_05740 [Candidatus Acetothermia bacterium]|jgi:hypothetical protein|nr:hypothetical protein [Candidatus Acetothermia bacterium]MDH7505786.1 hypothetical protein [Candidatus Acetothermia bacterium]
MGLRVGQKVLQCLLLLAMTVVGLAHPSAAGAERPFSAGLGFGLLELHRLRDIWGMTVETVQLLETVAEFGPRSGLGARFTGGFSLPGGPQVSAFETALLLHFPGRDSRIYLGGGSGILCHGDSLNFTLHLAAGLKRDLQDYLTVFLDVKLLGILELSGGLLFFPSPLVQFTPGLTFYL